MVIFCPSPFWFLIVQTVHHFHVPPSIHHNKTNNIIMLGVVEITSGIGFIFISVGAADIRKIRLQFSYFCSWLADCQTVRKPAANFLPCLDSQSQQGKLTAFHIFHPALTAQHSHYSWIKNVKCDERNFDVSCSSSPPNGWWRSCFDVLKTTLQSKWINYAEKACLWGDHSHWDLL